MYRPSAALLVGTCHDPRSLCGDGCHKAIQEASAKCAYGPPLIPNGICRVEFLEAERALVYPEKEAFTKFRRNLGIKALDTTVEDAIPTKNTQIFTFIRTVDQKHSNKTIGSSIENPWGLP